MRIFSLLFLWGVIMDLGMKVLELAKAAGYNEKEFAAQIGVSQPTVNGWSKDNRNPNSALINNICNTLGITPNALFEWPDTDSMGPDERELLEKFRLLGKVGQRAVLAEADEQLYRQRLEGDNSKTAT